MIGSWLKTEPVRGSKPNSAPIRGCWEAIERALWGVNLVADPTFLIWPIESAEGAAGQVSAAIAHWDVSAGTLQRCGAGLPDTKASRVRGWVVKVTPTTTNGYYLQTLIPAGSMPTEFGGRYVSIRASVAASGAAYGIVRDGVGQTLSAAHTGDGSWRGLTVVHQLDSAATQLEVGVYAPSGTPYVEYVVAVLGDIPPPGFIPCPSRYNSNYLYLPTVVGVGYSDARYISARPMLLTDVQLLAITAPTSTAILDVRGYDSVYASYYSVFNSGAITMAPGDNRTGQAVDAGAYRFRCLNGHTGTGAGPAPNSTVAAYVATVGGIDKVTVHFRGLQFERALEIFLPAGFA